MFWEKCLPSEARSMSKHKRWHSLTLVVEFYGFSTSWYRMWFRFNSWKKCLAWNGINLCAFFGLFGWFCQNPWTIQCLFHTFANGRCPWKLLPPKNGYVDPWNRSKFKAVAAWYLAGLGIHGLHYYIYIYTYVASVPHEKWGCELCMGKRFGWWNLGTPRIIRNWRVHTKHIHSTKWGLQAIPESWVGW